MNSLLSALPALGVVWSVVLFLLCFLCVHIARLVKFGWKYQSADKPREKRDEPVKKEQPEKKAPAEPAQNAPQEPIYYIVEKKRRAKTTFGEPKQIRFK